MVHNDVRERDLKPARVYLLGFMGAGKSTAGILLAEKLNWPLVELDALIERRAAKSISEIFARKGEREFRKLEQRCLREVSRREPPLIISCGGGVPLAVENRRLMKETGLPIYLHIRAETALERLGSDPTRPLLGDEAREVELLWEKRQKNYDKIEHRLEAENCSPQELVSELIDIIENNNVVDSE